jgi:hypothetical protein
MSSWQLAPDDLAQRVRATGHATHLPSMAESIARGIVGFTVISVAGFAPWAFSGLALYRRVGEAGLYAVSALVFIGLSGPLLHRLIIGPGSLSRFYKLFAVAFGAYAAAWTIGWMTLGGNKGSMAGLLAGTVLMGWIFAAAFDARSETWRIIGILFLGNVLGYFSGGWALDALSSSTRTHPAFDRLAWGICYGIGFGAALGLAFHLCQRVVCDRLRG